MPTFNTYDVVVRARLQNTAQNTAMTVRVATTAAGTLATSFENGDVVDGVTLATGNRILVKNQAAPAENGVYVVAVSGAPTRATDMDAWAEAQGAVVTVTEGAVNAGKAFVANVAAGGTLGTTALNFTETTLSNMFAQGQFPLDAGVTVGAATAVQLVLSVNGKEVVVTADPGLASAEATTLLAAIKQAVVDLID